MRQIPVPVVRNGGKETQLEYIYNLDELPYLRILLESKTSTKNYYDRKTDKTIKIHYIEVAAAFDIETTNMYQRGPDGKISKAFRPYAFMYHWQLCLGKYVMFGRRWEEFRHALDYISDALHLDTYDTRLVIYVHNLAFEFQFMRYFIQVESGFFREPYKPLKIVTKNGFEFRDSMALSNMNLDAFCKETPTCIHRKLTDDEERFDYSIIRTAATPLSDLEQAYCYNDVRGLCECIEYRLRDHTLGNIPMTSTGYVRTDARQSMAKNKRNRKLFTETALDMTLYTMMREAFRGGNTHANAANANKVVYDAHSYDITSEYPAAMMIDYFPIGAFSPYDPFVQKEQDPDMKRYCYIFHVLLEDVKFTGNHGIPYISISKCTHYAADGSLVEDNGRIRNVAYLEMTVTEIDWKIIKSMYSFSGVKIKDMYAAQRGPLPDELKAVIMKYFNQKTQLKGVAGEEYMYSRSKALLNSIYGMCVARLDMDLVTYDPNNIEMPYGQEGTPLEELLAKYYKSKNSFLPYQWGVWVTCHGRRRLQEMLTTVGPDVIYCDTDSIKFKGNHDKEFEELNKRLQIQAMEVGAVASNKDGKTYYLGTWSREEDMEMFKSLGAKKYIYQVDGNVTATIAGVNKEVGSKFFQNAGFDAFCNGTIIPDSGHLVAYRNNEKPHYIEVDHCKMLTASNMALVNDTYTLGVTGSYLELLRAVMDNIIYIEKGEM